jgi:hypothetical protein
MKRKSREYSEESGDPKADQTTKIDVTITKMTIEGGQSLFDKMIHYRDAEFLSSSSDVKIRPLLDRTESRERFVTKGNQLKMRRRHLAIMRSINEKESLSGRQERIISATMGI